MKKCLQLVKVMSRREILEGFRTASFFEIDKQDPFDEGLQLFKRNCLENLATHRLSFSEAAADADVVSFALVTRFDPEKANVANVVLGAGVRAAGDVQVDRLLDLEEAVEPVGESYGVGLGIGGGEAATVVARACNGSTKDCASFEVEPRGEDG